MMENKQLEQCLRETFITVNNEARLATPKVLERCMDAVFQEAGAEWFLETADRLKVTDTHHVRENLEGFLHTLRTDQGHAELKGCLAKKQSELKLWRRRLVQLIRIFGFGERGVEFSSDKLPDNGGIYHILAEGQENQDKGGSSEEGSDDHPCF
jgi:hypothetical protein